MMRTVVGGLILAILFVAAGAAFWSQAALANRVGEAHRRLATLKYDSDAALDSTSGVWDGNRWQMGLLNDDVQRHRANVTYWMGRYKALTPMIDLTGNEAVKDSTVLFAAANASYRESTPETGDRKIAVERLDKVMQGYADVMRLDPAFVDASYNYEYVARVRDTIAKGKKPAHPPINPTDSIKGDLPTGPTIHGLPGFPPAEVDLGDFKTLTPMKYEEREEQTDPGRGTFQRRRG
jgi:hypothetical protein